jgi:hypothetical protein
MPVIFAGRQLTPIKTSLRTAQPSAIQREGDWTGIVTPLSYRINDNCSFSATWFSPFNTEHLRLLLSIIKMKQERISICIAFSANVLVCQWWRIMAMHVSHDTSSVSETFSVLLKINRCLFSSFVYMLLWEGRWHREHGLDPFLQSVHEFRSFNKQQSFINNNFYVQIHRGAEIHEV